MIAGARIEAEEEKEHPMDFVLWKASKPGEPSWESPWGNGRPGWHIECSAMSLKYLGDTLDIHGGGQDLIFPHHENEIAQSESFTGKKPFVKYWMHNGLVQFGEEKMSKSLGNLITIKEALKKYSADTIRLFVLNSHYRNPLTFSEEALEAAKGGVERLLRVISRDNPARGEEKVLDAEPYRKRFIEAMDDDFNTPQALAVLFDLAREINQASDIGVSIDEAQNILLSLAREVFGLKLPPIKYVRVSGKIPIRATVKAKVIPRDTVKVRVNRLVEERMNCRKEKNWQQADKIRKGLAKLGITMKDTKTGTDVTYEFVSSEESLDRLLEELDIALEDTTKRTVWKRK
jgi:cysteinyl-tRNA synthetase